MKTWKCLVVLCAACGADGGNDTMVDPPIDPPLAMSALERCVLDGGTVKELWSVGNQHGPVSSIVAGPLVVLGAEDGSVKQWSIDGDEPAYGKPFTTAGAPVAALALSSDAHIVAATQHGELAEWRLADAGAARTRTLADIVPSALAISGDAATAVIGTETGQSFAVDRATGMTTQLGSSLWGVAAIEYGTGDRLYTAGHWYSVPQIERRAAGSPVEATDVWIDQSMQGWVRAIASDDAQLVAAGDAFVAVFAPDALEAGPIAITAADHMAVGIVLLPGGALFATAGSEGTLKLWKAATAELVTTLPIATPVGLAADTDGTRLFTSGPDGRLHAFGCE